MTRALHLQKTSNGRTAISYKKNESLNSKPESSTPAVQGNGASASDGDHPTAIPTTVLSEAEKRKQRAERFGVPASLDEKKAARAERYLIDCHANVLQKRSCRPKALSASLKAIGILLSFEVPMATWSNLIVQAVAVLYLYVLQCFAFWLLWEVNENVCKAITDDEQLFIWASHSCCQHTAKHEGQQKVLLILWQKQMVWAKIHACRFGLEKPAKKPAQATDSSGIVPLSEVMPILADSFSLSALITLCISEAHPYTISATWKPGLRIMTRVPLNLACMSTHTMLLAIHTSACVFCAWSANLCDLGDWSQIFSCSLGKLHCFNDRTLLFMTVLYSSYVREVI